MRSQYSFFERKRGVRGERGNLSSKKGFLSFPVSSVSDSLTLSSVSDSLTLSSVSDSLTLSSVSDSLTLSSVSDYLVKKLVLFSTRDLQ